MDIKTLALIFAVVAVAIAGFLLFQTQTLLSEVSTAVSAIPEPGASTSSTTSQSELILSELPETVQDFERSEFLPRVEPLLSGEEYSSLARYVPLEGTEFDGVVAGVGVMLYRFIGEEYVMPGLSVFSLGNDLGSFSFQGQEILWYYDEVTAQSVYFMIVGMDMVQVLSGARHKDDPNPEAMEAAALIVLSTLLAVNQ
jgi:hypothetical protein